MLRRVKSKHMEPRYRVALLGMVPIVVLLVSLNLAPWLTGLLGLPQWFGLLFAFLLAVLGYFISRAALRREFARSGPR